uniref:hypothetical protein n=1 Tax=Pseudomonas syringae TaxID=317 RepID=UPI001F2A70C2
VTQSVTKGITTWSANENRRRVSPVFQSFQDMCMRRSRNENSTLKRPKSLAYLNDPLCCQTLSIHLREL